MIWTSAFWKGAAERGIKTMAQTLAAYFVIGVTGVLEFEWLPALSITAAAGVASLLTSIGNADFVAGKAIEVTPATADKSVDITIE